MHKLFIKNDWEIHNIYDYDDTVQVIKLDKFQCKAGIQPDYEDLEVYYSNRMASIDYRFAISMSTYIFELMLKDNKIIAERNFLWAVSTICATHNENILIADYPDKLVFILPLIKEFTEFYMANYENPSEYIKEKVKMLSDRIEVTIDTNKECKSHSEVDDILDLYAIIIKYANVLTKSFCKKTILVNSDTFEITNDSYMEMDLCTSEISCRRIYKKLAENEIEIDAPLLPALQIANKVANIFGGKTNYSCCGHSYDLFGGYISFKFPNINKFDTRADYFEELMEKSLEENPKFEDYFYANRNGSILVIRFNDTKAIELAATLEPEEVVENIINKFIDMMNYIDNHKDDNHEKRILRM